MADYPIPPWLNPPNWGALAMQRNNAKMQLRLSQQRLGQQAEQFNSQMEMRRMAMEAEERVKQQQLQQQSQIAQHRLAVEAAYNNVRASMQQQQIANAERKVDLDFAKAKYEMGMRQRFEDSVAQRMRDQGSTAKEAFTQALYEMGPNSYAPASAYSAIKEPEGQESFTPSVFEKDGHTFAQVSPNRAQLIPQRQEPSVFSLTTPSGRKVEGVRIGNSGRILPPEKLTKGKATVRDIGHGLIGIQAGEKDERVIRAPKFEFSRESELEALEHYFSKTSDAMAAKLNKMLRSEHAAKKERLKALLDLRDKELKDWKSTPAEPEEDDYGEIMGEDEGGESFDFDFDPQSGEFQKP